MSIRPPVRKTAPLDAAMQHLLEARAALDRALDDEESSDRTRRWAGDAREFTHHAVVRLEIALK